MLGAKPAFKVRKFFL